MNEPTTTPKPTDENETPTHDAAVLEQQVEELLGTDASPEDFAKVVSEQEAADAADTLERLVPAESIGVLHELANEKGADALTEMAPELAATMLLDLFEMERGEAAAIVSLMDPDDAADIIQLLAPEVREQIIADLHPRRAAQIGKLALYDPETAGGLMTTDIIVVRDELTIGQTIDTIKRRKFNEEQLDVYVVDEKRSLIGYITLRDLLLQSDDDLVRDHIHPEVVTATPEVDQEEIARLFERYDLLTLPVVDEKQRVLGMITIDDVVDIIREEQTEDAFKQVGAGTGEAVYSTVRKKVRGRMPWLMVNLVTASLAASVVLAFTDMIELVPVAAILFPIVANQAGNTGFQSLAVTLRGITLKEIHKERVTPLVHARGPLGRGDGPWRWDTPLRGRDRARRDGTLDGVGNPLGVLMADRHHRGRRDVLRHVRLRPHRHTHPHIDGETRRRPRHRQLHLPRHLHRQPQLRRLPGPHLRLPDLDPGGPPDRGGPLHTQPVRGRFG